MQRKRMAFIVGKNNFVHKKFATLILFYFLCIGYTKTAVNIHKP